MGQAAALYLPTAWTRFELALSELPSAGVSSWGGRRRSFNWPEMFDALIRGNDLGFDSEREFLTLGWVSGPQSETPEKPDLSTATNDQGRKGYGHKPHASCRRSVSALGSTSSRGNY
jgi:hypothetical protein